MKRMLDENTVTMIHNTLIERFGEPIGDIKNVAVGVADERNDQKENVMTCESCGGMLEIDENVCTQCGMMSSMDESENGGRHLGHASSCTCPDCSRSHEEMNPSLDEEDLVQKAPPGREKQVKALKKQKGINNPFAVAWNSYNKSHKK